MFHLGNVIALQRQPVADPAKAARRNQSVTDQVRPERIDPASRRLLFAPFFCRRNVVLASFVDGPVIGRPSFCLATSAGLFLF